MMRRTKIVATLGPACWEEPMLSRLLEAGVDVCRINSSHSNPDGIIRQVARVRKAAMRLQKSVAILLDLQGPKIRTGEVHEPIALDEGDILTIVMDPHYTAHDKSVGTTYPQMATDVLVGTEVLFADGVITGVVTDVRRDCEPAEVDVRIDNRGKLGSHKGINLPGVAMSIPSLSEKDIEDLKAGISAGVDYIALSFVRSAQDILDLKRYMLRFNADIPIIAKIEKPQAVEHLSEILEEVDGVMVARGDLGVEVRIERVPVFQKRIIEEAFGKGKLIITATQMLDSMERNPRPTRAETTDVANAILDGTDAVMLSGETSIGDYPLESVKMMDSIAREVEQSKYLVSSLPQQLPVPSGLAAPIYRAAIHALQEGNRPIIVFTWSGKSAHYLSKARPKTPIFALTPSQETVDRLSLVWGVVPILAPSAGSSDEMIENMEQLLKAKGLLSSGEEVLIIAGETPLRGAANFLKIDEVR